MKKGSEILKDKVIIGLNLMTEFDNAIIKMTSIRAIAFINSKLEGTVVVPEEIWLKLEEETKRLVNKIEALQLSIQSIYNPRIKILEDKQEKLRMLIENLDFTEANGRYGKVYLKDDSLFSIWLEELRRLIQE